MPSGMCIPRGFGEHLMKITKTFVFLGAMVLAGSSFANILVNPGFETGDLTGWTSSSFTATNNDAHTGSWSVINNGNFTIEQSFAPVNPADVTEVSVWAKQPDLSGFFFAIDFLYSDSSYEEFYGSAGDQTTWTKFDFVSDLNMAKTLTGIRLYGNSGGTTQYDDFTVNVNPVPEPASLAVLGLGAAALIRRRKK